VAAIPFLWILPLALYLLSFILCFDSEIWYRRRVFSGLLAVALGGMCYALTQWEGSETVKVVIPLFSAGLFICCMFCHGELARLKPHSRYLTSFYLMISLGGALGGLFVGWLAPRLFHGYFELPVGIFACTLLALVVFRDQKQWMFMAWAALAVTVLVFLALKERDTAAGARVMVRNFYGGLRVTDSGDLRKEDATRTLVHGTITHGLQFLAPASRRLPTTYYGRQSGVGLAIENCRHSGERVGVIGLGVGTLACYGQPGDYYRFYEINPLVIDVARREFTYLRDSPAQVDVVLGDARLSLEREPSQNFDVLAVDAFSSDSIPVHLLTREAFQLYFHHLKPQGVLAVHISNTHLDLAPVVQSEAAALHKEALLFDTEDDEQEVYGATWVLLAGQKEVMQKPAFRDAGTPLKPRPSLRLWTDDYSNLFQILK
jgi:SAM-dependent methyltransferase